MKRLGICIIILIGCYCCVWGRDNNRFQRISAQLDSLAKIDSKFLEPVDVSVTNFSVSELLKSLAIGNSLNVNLSNEKNKRLITCNLDRVPIKNVLLLCCQCGELDVTIENGIVSFFPYKAPESCPIVIERDSSGLYRMDFSACKVDAVVRKLIDKSGKCIMYSPSIGNHQITGYGVNLSFETMMENIAVSNGLQCEQNQDGAWMIEGRDNGGKSHFSKKAETLPDNVYCVRVIPMQYRTTDDVVEIIPSQLVSNVEIKVSADLNSLVLAGNTKDVEALEEYLKTIDKSIPLISIDVIIVDATNRKNRSTGVKFGKGKEPSLNSYGTLSPGVDVSLGANKINQLIRAFNGLGLVNLGAVGPNFYADLKLLEEDGVVKLRSTPKLSTLNGHKATLKSGEVKYYKESQVNIIGTQNPLQSESFMWKNVEASFALNITPVVSADSLITIRVELNQDEFTERDGGDLTSPPGITKRSFNSIVKVKNGEMVLLGGIEKNLLDESSSGLPWVSRVPVLRLFSGNVTKIKESQKLNVFIKPSIML